MAETTASDEFDLRPEFPGSFRGYRRQDVDEWVRAVRVRFERQAAALREAEQRLAELGADPGVPIEHAGSGTIGARVERIIALAESEAEELREQAELDAARIRAAVEHEADQARRFREQAAKAAADESRRMIQRAEEEVTRLRETRKDLMAQLLKIGETVDRVTDRLEETAPKPRQPEAEPAETKTETKAEAETGTTEPPADGTPVQPLADAKARLEKVAATP
ncbi:hypothetical protein SAMN05421835_101477 [Amycolatopsis sacchari]|uniref:Antigen 84 n=1 Tax=Amycolatopsis sacchari TaxID=115433 RepID=A0A1I3KAW0_9PSEU|nr:hypothetical protein [Amycolatopsis sacchari]SFI69470.1 hypothetical protein SAMN05421835_101477 [Amycolatopsis sacchari]